MFKQDNVKTYKLLNKIAFKLSINLNIAFDQYLFYDL